MRWCIVNVLSSSGIGNSLSPCACLFGALLPTTLACTLLPTTFAALAAGEPRAGLRQAPRQGPPPHRHLLHGGVLQAVQGARVNTLGDAYVQQQQALAHLGREAISNLQLKPRHAVPMGRIQHNHTEITVADGWTLAVEHIRRAILHPAPWVETLLVVC